MKYTRGQFTNEYYRLWALGLQLPAPVHASIYSVKFRKNEKDEYSRVTLQASSISDALERACYAITYSSPWRPEDIDLHAVYDVEENLLWIDEPFYDLVQKKNEFRGMDRREFLARFGMTTAAILFGLRPQKAFGQFVPFSFVNKIIPPTGEQLYTTAGSYTWTVPSGVTSVCVVCVGGGGGGAGYQSEGAGGGLGWKNNITVSPASSISVVSGRRGRYSDANSNDGGASYFNSTSDVVGWGGQGGRNTSTATALGGSYVGTGGGSGGNSPGQSNWLSYAGSGGAGGYSGAGGNGGLPIDNTTTSTAGTSGAGGGGGGGSGARPIGGGGYGGGTGGGVGLYGQGTNGAAGASPTSSGSAVFGLDGSPGSGGTGTTYGGGGQGSTDAGVGAVRIIWGSGRSFPSNAT